MWEAKQRLKRKIKEDDRATLGIEEDDRANREAQNREVHAIYFFKPSEVHTRSSESVAASHQVPTIPAVPAQQVPTIPAVPAVPAAQQVPTIPAVPATSSSSRLVRKRPFGVIDLDETQTPDVE